MILLDEITLITEEIIKKAKSAIIFGEKCMIVSSILSDIIETVNIFQPNEELWKINLLSIKESLITLSKIMDNLQTRQFIMTLIYSNEPIHQIIIDINYNMKKINRQLQIMNIESFNLPPDHLYSDYDHIDYLFEEVIRLAKQKRVEIDDNLKQMQRASIITEGNFTYKDNINELNRFPQFKKNESDFSYNNTVMIDSNKAFDYYKGKLTQNDQNVTIMILKNNNIFKRLLTVLATIKHPYVETFIGSYIKGSKIFIITNRDGAKLSNILYQRTVENEISLTSGDRTILAFKIAQAMSYLHSKSILHRNLSTSNIFVTKIHNDLAELEIQPLVVGFRNSRLMPDENTIGMSSLGIKSPIPVSFFRAPELDDGQYNEGVDVFSFAGILFELLTGHPPFGDELHHNVINMLKKNQRPALPEDISDELKKLITGCWDQDPKERFTFDEVISFMIDNKVIFPCDSESQQKVNNFYERNNSIRIDYISKCIELFKSIKRNIGYACQYRFELLRIRPILNRFQYLLTFEYDNGQNNEDEKNEEELIKLKTNLHSLQNIVINLTDQKSWLNSLRLSSSAELTNVTKNLTELMNKIYESMKTLGFNEIDQYIENDDDLVFDYRELSVLFQHSLEQNFSFYAKLLNEIDQFRISRNLDSITSERAKHKRITDLFTPFKEYEIKRNEIEIDKSQMLGRGASSVVYEGTIRINHEKVAVKVLNEESTSNENQRMSLRKEIGYLTTLKHEYIAEFIGFSLSNEDNSVWFIFKHYPDGTLDKQIHDNSINLSPNEKTKIAFKLAKVMNYIHSNSVLHMDFKAGNVMMDGNNPKIIDFGNSNPDNSALKPKIQIGTNGYISPEAFEGEGKIEEKSDVFSYAITLWELYTELNPPEQYFRCKANKRVELNFEGEISPSLKKLIEMGTKIDPNERPKFEQIIQKMISECIMFPGSNEIDIHQFYDEESKKITNSFLNIKSNT